ncbi:MAG: N-acetylmuramoyl-L-alanine amidase [Pseudomonadota bacterium]
MKFAFKQFLLFIVLCCTSFLILATSANVKETSALSNDNQLHIEIPFTEAVKYHYFFLSSPNRLVIDFDTTKTIKTPPLNLTSTPWIHQIRVAYRTPKTQRMVFEFSEAVKGKVTLLHSPNSTTWKLSIDLQPPFAYRNSVQEEVKAFDKEATQINKTSSATKTADAYLATAHCVNIVIDPGHGGHDSGAVGLHGTQEKNVVLAISKYLNDLIKQTPGMCAYMTRDTDNFVSLRGRIDFARKKSADIFIAIHADMFKNTTAHGATVFALSQRGATSEAARWIAHNENVAHFLEIGDTPDKDKDLQSILMDISQNETINRSLILGKAVLQQLDDVSKLHHIIVEQAGFVVLKSPDIPSILVETGFLSNKSEEAQLTQSTYQKKIALAIYRGIMKYSQNYSLTHSKSTNQAKK